MLLKKINKIRISSRSRNSGHGTINPLAAIFAFGYGTGYGDTAPYVIYAGGIGNGAGYGRTSAGDGGGAAVGGSAAEHDAAHVWDTPPIEVG